MPLKGDIKTFPLSAVGRMLNSEKKTGVLKVTSGGDSTSIYFKRGGIVFIDGDLSKDLSLGSLLKAVNVISEDDIQKSLEIARSMGKRLGVVMIEQGYISQEKLINILNYQFKEAIVEVLSWDEGEFTYSDGLDGYIEDIRLEIDPIRLVAEAQKWKEYRDLIPNDKVVFQIKDGAQRSKTLSTDGIQRVMLLIDGKRNVSQIIAESGLSRLAVYKAFSVLLSKDVVAREGMRDRKVEPGLPDDETIIKFYLNLLHEIMVDLADEIGGKKAGSFLEKSLNHPPYYENFLCAFQPDADVITNLRLIREHLGRQKKKILRKDIINGFNHVVVNLLQEEYQLLGFRASKNTVSRANAVLKLAPQDQKSLARNMIRFFDQYCEDEGLLRGIKSLSSTMDLDQNLTAEGNKSLLYSVDKIRGATIIAFYSKVVQMLMSDLENEIGTKALNLFQNIVRNSEYYDTFLSQFDVKNDINTNVKSISNHIRTQGHKLDKQGMVLAFQQVVMALLHEEKRLLGDKATQLSIFNIEGHMAATTEVKYKPLTDHLTSFLRNRSAWSGG
jgi:hypothetical protein